MTCMIASNDILCKSANFMPPMRTSLFYAAHKARVAIADVIKLPNFGRSAVAPNASSPRVLSRMS